MRIIPCVVAASLAVPALAVQPWIGPTDYTPFPQEQVDVRQLEGPGFSGDALPRRHSDIRNVWVIDGEMREVGSAGQEGASSLTRVTNGDDRGVLVAWRSTLVSREQAASEFHDFLVDNGLRGPLSQRELVGASWPATEVCERSGKSWLAGAEIGRARAPIGIPLEIVPLRDPAIVESLEIEVLWEGRPLPGALVKVYRQNLGERGLPLAPGDRLYQPVDQRLRTDRHGRTRIDVAPRGEYLVTVMHAVPQRDPQDPSRAWATHCSTLTFARGAALDDDDGDWPDGYRRGHGRDMAAAEYESAPRRDSLGR